MLNLNNFNLELNLPKATLAKTSLYLRQFALPILTGVLIGISLNFFIYFYQNGLGLAYNDARSHLDIGRRVVEGLKPGLAQLGSVWLPLPHILMIPTIWNDFMWHSGLSGSLVSMIAFVGIGLLIYFFLRELNVGFLGRVIGVLIFVANINVLYLQSIAMTELLLMATMTAACYELLLWHKNSNLLHLIKSSFWIMMASLVRYDGWFLLIVAVVLVSYQAFRKFGYKTSEGIVILFTTLASFGILLWFGWNQLIFKDALYFVFGPFSARAQQAALEKANVLATKGNLIFSSKIYFYALAYNSGAFTTILAAIAALIFWFDKNISRAVRIVSLSLFTPIIFNILALYLGHSVLFVQGLSGNTWFNARYGIMMMPTIAIFIGFLIHKLVPLRGVLILLLAFVSFFSLTNGDAVTIDDARVGSSQKNVSEVSGWLKQYAANEKGFILISAASHDAIIFSSGLPMKRFIHEGTGAYWESATTSPDRWARWIIMRTNDNNDLTFKAVSQTPAYSYYDLVSHFPFADIYQLKNEYLGNLNTEPILGKNI